MAFFNCSLFQELDTRDKFRTVGIKTWKNTIFKRPFFPYFLPPIIWLIESFFIFIFSLLHSQNSCWASRIWNTWSSPLAPLSYFGKMHFYVLSKSSAPIFNVSRLGQLSDLFLLLFFAPYHCWNIDVMQCLSQFAALFFPPPLQHFPLWLLSKILQRRMKGFSIILTSLLLSHGVPPVPSGPPRKVEVEAVNSSSIKVIWRSPMPTKQHGQIRGYQVHYVRMVNGEPTGQPVIKDILIDDAQVQHPPQSIFFGILRKRSRHCV